MLTVIKHILTLLLIIVPLQLLGLIIVALALTLKLKDKRIASSKLESQRLPKLFSWYDVGDPLDRKYGLNGDLGYQSHELVKSGALREGMLQNAIVLLYDPEFDGKTVPTWKIFWLRYKWLALRNPLNGFKYNKLGVKKDDIKRILLAENWVNGKITNIEEVGDWSNPGFRYTEVELKDGTVKKEYYWVKKLSSKKCIRIRIGHKFGHLGSGDVTRETISWVCAIQPYKSYKGS